MEQSYIKTVLCDKNDGNIRAVRKGINCKELKRQIVFTRLLSDYSNMTVDGDDGIVSLSNLWRVKQNPYAFRDNTRIDNIVECSSEIASPYNTEYDTVIYVDTSLPSNGFNLAGLRTVAGTVCESNIDICYCCAPLQGEDISTVVNALREQLLVGSVIEGTNFYTKAVAIVCELLQPLETNNSSVLNDANIGMLQAVGQLHKSLQQTSTSNSKVPPILLRTSATCTKHEQILEVLIAAGADISTVVICQATIRPLTIDYWQHLLLKYSCSIAVDTWGYAHTFSSTGSHFHSQGHATMLSAVFPQDTEMIQGLIRLVSNDFSLCNRIILSLDLFCKVQLSKYGGHGYGYIRNAIVPLLRHYWESGSNCPDQLVQTYLNHDTISPVPLTTPTRPTMSRPTSDTIIKMWIEENAFRLLNWRPAPAVVEIPVDTLPCDVCGARFPLGDHYSKFQFVYCSSKCLIAHRKAGWSDTVGSQTRKP